MFPVQQQWIRQLFQLCFLNVVLVASVENSEPGSQNKQSSSASHPIRDGLVVAVKVLFYLALAIAVVAALAVGACFVVIFAVT
jgi:hypothetical protein